MAQTNNRGLVSVFGLVGSGKTTLAAGLAREYARVVIVDGGYERENDFPGDRVENWWSFHDYMTARAEGLFRVRFCATPDEFDLVCEWCRVAGDLCLIVDESDRYLVQGKIPDSFMDLVARGRHYGEYQGVSMVVIAQNPMQIPIDVRRQSTEICCFNTAEPADVDWLRKMIGDEWGQKAPMLSKGRYIRWVKGVGSTEEGAAL